MSERLISAIMDLKSPEQIEKLLSGYRGWLDKDYITDEMKVEMRGYIKMNAEDQSEILSEDGLMLRYVIKQTEDLCLVAVGNNGLALQNVENQTKEICLSAVKNNGLALQFVKKQTDKICSEAVKQNDKALDMVTDLEMKDRVWKSTQMRFSKTKSAKKVIDN